MPSTRADADTKLKIAVIGGGYRCLAALEMLESQFFRNLQAEVIGVADLNGNAAGICRAREMGIFTTGNCQELFALEGLDLVIELTSDQNILRKMAETAPNAARVINVPASRLFHDIVAVYRTLQARNDEVSLAQSFAQALISATSEAVMVLDREHRILQINQAALTAAGLSREEALGKYCFQVSHQYLTPCDSQNIPCPMKSTLASGKSAHAIHEHTMPSGGTHYCDVSTYPLFNRQGETLQVLELSRDITDDLALRMEKRTAAIKADLAALVQEDKLVALGKLVASVAHEINNPLAAIINFVKLMHKGLLTGKCDAKDLLSYETYLDLCAKEAERCATIVTNLLSFARQQTPSPRQVDLTSLLSKTILLTRHRMKLANVELVLDLPTEGLSVWGDPSQLQQVFTNLIFNAIEAMPRGGKLSVGGRLEPDGKSVVLYFKDTGEGIAPENLSRVFEPFFSTKEEGHGVGLGLSMVYGIIREHRGEVGVDSRPGEETVFQISLPFYSPEGEAGGKAEP